MSTLTLRGVKGSPLTTSEMDTNLTNLNNDKIESTGITFEALNTNGDVGVNAGQLSEGNHAHSDKADLNSPVFTGTPSLPTGTIGVTQTAGDNSTKLATTAFVIGAISGVGGSIPAGSVMVFYQAAAPTGWTQVTTQNDKALRVVSGAGGGTGGTAAFSSPSHTLSGGATTLSTSQMPSHTHDTTLNTLVGGIANGTLSIVPTDSGGTVNNVITNSTGGGGSHTHPLSGSITTPQYIDVIICSKD